MFSGLAGWHVLILMVWLVPLVLWIVALVQIAQSKSEAGPTIGWIAVVTLVPLVGPILWFALGRRRIRGAGTDRLHGDA
ncbi:PLD nuclease N-terminal domain-containing protein [Leifsonia sp. C5G2]|uniref:PLD nuclease N-terminal domain-containing protein n=1 Tax=Leifsonia sp. C5G2 TaxID=2735269 RepID=UPI0015853CA6|nr:PLD nuclease N-terminal domain-containing protein [Leifsonia sp. C5G2]NUU07415.1 PLDc_N domain-containing protein [Leifsonia sp. C5G2]